MNWSINTPPLYCPNAVATQSGWADPTTGEILVAIRGLAVKGAGANVESIVFNQDSYLRGDTLYVTVRFNERVSVSAGASIVISSTGSLGRTLYALAQSNTQTVVFNKAVNLSSAVTVGDEAATLSLAAQTISGTINDYLDSVKATGTLTLTANAANAETVTIDGKAYTFQTTLTNVDGNVALGSSLVESLSNLAEAINANSTGLAGTAYAAATTAHSTVTAVQTGDTLVVTAKTAGTAGNSITTTETLGHGSWGGETLASGAVQASVKTVSAGVGTAAGSFVVKKAAPEAVAFDEEAYEREDELTVTVTFDGTVDIPASGASIVVTSTQNSGDITLWAAETEGETDVVFQYAADLETAVTIPDEAGTLSVATQTIGGTVYDSGTELASTKTISEAVAATAETRVIAAPVIESVAFDEESYTQGANLSLTVTYDEPVDVTAGSTIVVGWTGATGNLTLKAAAQSDVTEVVYNKQEDGATQFVVPSEAGTLSLADQTLGGTIKDGATAAVAASKVVSEAQATDCGTRVVAA